MSNIKKNNAAIYDINTLIQAGIDPKTGLPLKVASHDKACLKPNIKKLLQMVDEQDAINRYKWYNLPDGLDSQMIERILYYKGQGMFFYSEQLDKFFFLPYALDGSIDIYGRFTRVKPMPFNGSKEAEDKNKKLNPIARYISMLSREPVYDIWLDELTADIFDKKCVLISDYSKQISQTNISRSILNDPLLDVMSDMIPFLRTSLLNSTGISAVRVNSQDDYIQVKLASTAIDNAALSGEKYIPTVGTIDFQELASGNVAKSEEFLLSMQSLDNFRLGLYGLENGGLFQKKAHMLQSEQDINAGSTGLAYQDGMTLRQNAADIINSIWGLGVYCDASETVLGLDKNLDGQILDTVDQSGNMPGEQPEEVEDV